MLAFDMLTLLLLRVFPLFMGVMIRNQKTWQGIIYNISYCVATGGAIISRQPI